MHKRQNNITTQIDSIYFLKTTDSLSHCIAHVRNFNNKRFKKGGKAFLLTRQKDQEWIRTLHLKSSHDRAKEKSVYKTKTPHRHVHRN